MSYQAYDVARLHGRDFLFFIKYLQKRIVSNSKRCRPIVICNSYPKSGTHLLYQILYSLPGLLKWEDIVSVQALCGIINTANHIRWKIGSAPDSSIVRAHLMYCEEIKEILRQEQCKVIFIYRDLRDVALSHARWVTKETRIFLHDIYLQQENLDRQLMCSIKGVPIGTPFGSNLSQPDIGQDFLRWKGWIEDSNILAVKFEDLIGERGGGSEQKRIEMVEKIVSYLGVNLAPEQIKTQFASSVMNPRESHTFMKGAKGRKGGWKNVFKEVHKEAFKKVAGELLIELGYENNLNW